MGPDRDSFKMGSDLSGLDDEGKKARDRAGMA